MAPQILILSRFLPTSCVWSSPQHKAEYGSDVIRGLPVHSKIRRHHLTVGGLCHLAKSSACSLCIKNTAKRNTHSRVAYIFQSPPTPLLLLAKVLAEAKLNKTCVYYAIHWLSLFALFRLCFVRMLQLVLHWFTLLIFVSPLLFFSSLSPKTITIIIGRLHLFVVVFVVIMRECRNRFIPHYHADIILYPVNMC